MPIAVTCSALASMLTAGGCATSPEPTGPHNVVIDGLFVEPAEPVAGQLVVLSALIRDDLAHDVSVAWAVSGGVLLEEGFGALWRTPPELGAYRVDLTVADTDGLTASISWFVPVLAAEIIMEPGDTAPVIESFTATATELVAGEMTTLCVVASDIDSDPLNYTWNFPPGFMTADGTCATYTAFGGACLPGSYPFTVRVDDGRGGIAEATLSIWIDPFG